MIVRRIGTWSIIGTMINPVLIMMMGRYTDVDRGLTILATESVVFFLEKLFVKNLDTVLKARVPVHP
jgi:hypothetical protein